MWIYSLNLPIKKQLLIKLVWKVRCNSLRAIHFLIEYNEIWIIKAVYNSERKEKTLPPYAQHQPINIKIVIKTKRKLKQDFNNY